MKNVFAIGLICLAFSACSTGYYGTYRGKVGLRMFKDRTAASDERREINDVIVLIEPKGDGGTIEFTETGFRMSKCKLKLDVISDKPVYAPGQTCEFEFDGMMQDFTVDEIGINYTTENEPTMSISVAASNDFTAKYDGNRNHAHMIFKGVPYEKKKQ